MQNINLHMMNQMILETLLNMLIIYYLKRNQNMNVLKILMASMGC